VVVSSRERFVPGRGAGGAPAGWAALFLVWAAAGCSVGNGSGSVTGIVNAPSCDLSAASYDLEPTFFGAQPVLDHLEIRVQRGSDLDIRSDGILILVQDPDEIRESLLGAPITLGSEFDSAVRMSLYLGETCPVERSENPVNYEAESGTIVFDNMYAPSVDEEDVEIAARFTDARLVDRSDPDTRNATLNGEFRFLYTRGRPAQRYP